MTDKDNNYIFEFDLNCCTFADCKKFIKMAKKIKKHQVEKIESVGEAVSKSELFFKKHGKLLTYIGMGLVVIAAVIILLIQFYFKPLKKEAISQTFYAEQFFRADDFDKALNGDGNVLGFAQIIEEYGSKAGKSVYMYAGICELQLGKAEEALEYLRKYKTNDAILKARATACMGDACSMMEDYENALKYYVAAANTADNNFAASYLLKAGIMCEELGRNQDALAHYRTIKDKYPQTYEGYEIDKYISRIEAAGE